MPSLLLCVVCFVFTLPKPKTVSLPLGFFFFFNFFHLRECMCAIMRGGKKQHIEQNTSVAIVFFFRFGILCARKSFEIKNSKNHIYYCARFFFFFFPKKKKKKKRKNTRRGFFFRATNVIQVHKKKQLFTANKDSRMGEEGAASSRKTDRKESKVGSSKTKKQRKTDHDSLFFFTLCCSFTLTPASRRNSNSSLFGFFVCTAIINNESPNFFEFLFF